mgnify:CR=1 FL=1
MRALELKDYDVVLIDLNYSRDTTSGDEGLELLKRIRLADAADVGGHRRIRTARGVHRQIRHLRVEVAHVLHVEIDRKSVV